MFLIYQILTLSNAKNINFCVLNTLIKTKFLLFYSFYGSINLKF